MNLEHAVDAAARTHWETWLTAVPPLPVRRWDHLSDTEREEVRALVRPIVEAAAPWIAQSVLRAESYRWDNDMPTHIEYRTYDVANDIEAHADEIQAVTR